MIRPTITLLAGLALVTASFAGTEMSSKEIKPAAAPSATCFQDQELTLDVFGSYNDAIRNGHGNYFHDRSGGGVGANFFFMRYFGIGADANWSASGPQGAALHQLTGNVILRYPMQLCGYCVAPYVYGGGGEVFDGKQTSSADAGVGAEVRLTPHIGLFADWRYNWMNQNRGNVDTARSGVRFAF